MLVHHNLCRNCLLQQERRVCCHLKEGALDRTMWRAPVGGGFRPVVRQTTNEHSHINSVSHSMAHPQFWDRENNLQIWKVPAKIMNNRSQSADKG